MSERDNSTTAPSPQLMGRTTELIGKIAHQITGAINGNCCHRTGGLEDIPTCECRDAAERLLEAFPAIANAIQPAPAEHVVVKPLEWKKVALDSNNWNWLTVATAETPFGTYSIDKHTKGYLRVMFGMRIVSHFEPDQRGEAEAGAQADYERRIRSALAATSEGGE